MTIRIAATATAPRIRTVHRGNLERRGVGEGGNPDAGACRPAGAGCPGQPPGGGSGHPGGCVLMTPSFPAPTFDGHQPGGRNSSGSGNTRPTGPSGLVGGSETLCGAVKPRSSRLAPCPVVINAMLRSDSLFAAEGWRSDPYRIAPKTSVPTTTMPTVSHSQLRRQRDRPEPAPQGRKDTSLLTKTSASHKIWHLIAAPSPAPAH